MGEHPNIGFVNWPKQGPWLNRRVLVCFDYDTTAVLSGRIVRDDAEEPGRCIIALDDGRHVLTTECQWTPQPGTARFINRSEQT